MRSAFLCSRPRRSGAHLGTQTESLRRLGRFARREWLFGVGVWDNGTYGNQERSDQGVGRKTPQCATRQGADAQSRGSRVSEGSLLYTSPKAKQATNRRKMADPRLAARRRAAKFTSDSDDLVIGRNAVLEALRVGVPSMQLYIATRIEHDDRTREIIKLAGAQSLHLLEADRLEMDRIARSSNHQGVVLKVQPYQYSSLAELADIAERKAKAMDVVNSPSARINARPLFIALDGVTDPQNLGAVIRSAAAFGANGVILPERRSASVPAAAWKVSAGAAAHIPVARVVNLTKAIESMRERGYYTVGLDGGGDKLVGETGFETDPLIVVLGSEGKGLSRLVRESCDAIAGIPITSMVESLNASVAAGISLYAVARARREAAAAATK